MAVSRTLFASDLHLTHKNIIRYRTAQDFPGHIEPGMTQEDHDHFVVQSLIDSVTKRDTLWLLGDVGFGPASLPFLKQISDSVAYLNLVLGNHCFQGFEAGKGLQAVLDEGIFHRIEGMASIKIKAGRSPLGVRKAWLTHCPMHPAELRGHQVINIHGHLHKGRLDDPRYFNANIENTGFKAVDIDAIISGYKGV